MVVAEVVICNAEGDGDSEDHDSIIKTSKITLISLMRMFN